MNLLSLGAWDWLVETINGLFLVICNLLYTIVVWLYEVFDAVAKVNLFSREVFDELTGRIYVVVGVMMLFVFAYNLILMIINPDDKKSTANTTKVVKETIISLVLVILLPTIFNYMYIFQNHVLESNIIGQIILGSVGSTSGDSTNCRENDYDCSCDFSGYGLDKYTEDDDLFFDDTLDVEEALVSMCQDYKRLTASKRGAYSIAAILMSAFYKPTNFTFVECVEYLQGDTSKISSPDEQNICVNYFYDVTASKYTGNVTPFVLDGFLRGIVSDSDENSMEFNFIMAVIAGVLAIIMFFCYAMEVGVRVAKLGLLQMISPITVMMRIIPQQKEKVYDKWFNMLINTYLDVFMRLAIIYFALFSISLVPDVIDTLFESFENSNAGFLVKTLALVFVILGILRFAQEAPSLIKEFFGGSGNFSLKSPKKQFNDNKMAKGAVGYLGGAALGAASGAKKGKAAAIGGFFRGGKNAARNMSQADLTKKGAFLDTMKNSKYQTDYEQAHTKFKALRSDINRAGGIGGYIKSQGQNFAEFIGDTNNQTERHGAANKLFADSALINDMIINGVVKDEGNAKDAWAQNKAIALGDNYYRRDDSKGVWVDSNGNEYVKSAMKKEMDDYYKNRKITEMAEALANKDKPQNIEAFKQWSADFNDTLMDNIPKLSQEVSERFFQNISKEGGIQISNMDGLMATMQELQKKGVAGDAEAFKSLATLKVAMDKGFKDIKDTSYDMNPKKDK